MKFLEKLWERIKALYLSLKPETKRAITIAIDVTTRLNTFVNSKEADLLTLIIPGTADDRIKEKLRIVLPEVLKELRLADIYINDPSIAIKSARDILNTLDKDAKSGFLHLIAVLIARKLSEIKWSDAVATVEYKYTNS